ncbi:hypothetical protein FOQG_04726 [Fusarium oxysporum f. sp. raphani 54005]|uniref:F-box domain-containing protein n=2 Tax=Fusarium oxysporum f. sp. raphani TaxID=96318 RepID=X0CGX1_FUSOX|nr:hypothetical protein FOQG_04726 [Fusarium oxysporum f. sp. raphani 54005]KAG7438308.1 hypothetical protein Forpi1262_v001821 [Fusarium oxysporum f. sp. raphani]
MDENDKSLLAASRKDELDTLFASLSPFDILYLRKKISETTIVLAGLEKLPPEMVCEILKYFDFDDYRACLAVSKSWKAKFGQRETMAQALHNFFPGLVPMNPKDHPQKLFSLELNKHLKWMHPHDSRTWTPWDLSTNHFFSRQSASVHSKGVPWPFLYNKGRLVWQLSTRIIIVDDIRKANRERFSPLASAMRGGRFQAAAISDQFLILLDLEAGLNKIHVAKMDTRDWVELTLPTGLDHAYVDLRKMFFVTTNGQIFSYSWRETLEKVDLSGIGHAFGPQPGCFGLAQVLPHPQHDNVFFAVWALSHPARDPNLCTLKVVKFKDGKIVATKTKPIPNPLQNPQPGCNEVTRVAITFSSRKSDDHGTYTLATYRFQGIEKRKLELCDCCDPKTLKGDWNVITFNLFTESFANHEFLSADPDLRWNGPRAMQHHRNVKRLADAHFWKGDLVLASSITYDDLGPQNKPEYYTETHLETLRPLDRPAAPVPQWRPMRHADPGQVLRTKVFQDDDFVIVPSLGGVALYKPEKQAPNAGTLFDHTLPSQELVRESLPLKFQFWQNARFIELKHEDDPVEDDEGGDDEGGDDGN